MLITCKDCTHAVLNREGDYNCTRFPPQFAGVIRDNKGNQGTIWAFPVVKAEHSCGERKIKLVS